MQGKRFQSQRWVAALVGGIAALSFASSALALMSVPFGWYLEANGGSANLSNRSYPGNSSSSGFGGNANVGYKFMPYFAAEIGYTMYPNTSIKDSTGTKAGTDKHRTYDIAAKGIIPIGASGAEVFAKLGSGQLKSNLSINNSAAAALIGLGSSSHSATALYIGAGAQYYFMPELAVVAQWQRAQGNSNTGNEDLWSGGLSFIFD